MNIIEGLSLNEVLLMPKYSEINSRRDVDISVNLPKEFKFELPFTPSNMATITELEMAKTFHSYKSLAVFHRFGSFDQQLQWLEEIKSWHDGARYVGFSVGIKEQEYSRVDALVAGGAQILLIDVANGWSKNCIEMTKYVANKYPHILLISGNVASGEGAADLWKFGCDIVKANIGSGSLCSTRIRSGCGSPTILTLQLCADKKQSMEKYLGRKLYVIQDGGAYDSGGVAKTLALADMYMGGNLFAATDQAAGDIIEVKQDNIIKKYKQYVGSSTHKDTFKEGIETLKEYQGDVKKIIEHLCEGIRSCCSYNGAHNLEKLKENPQWVKITEAGYNESKPHDYDILVK